MLLVKQAQKHKYCLNFQYTQNFLKPLSKNLQRLTYKLRSMKRELRT